MTRTLGWVAWLVAIAMVVLTLVAQTFQVTVLGIAMVYAIASTGVALQLKTLRLLSLAQGSMMALGAYAQLILVGRYGWTFLDALAVSLLAAVAVGIVLGLASARVRSHYYILLTAAVQAIGAACISGLVSLTGGAQGAATPGSITIVGIHVASIKELSIVAAGVAVGVCALADFIYRSALGRRLIAVGVAPVLARGSGISASGANVWGNVLLALTGTLAGSLYAPLIGYLGPEVFALSASITCLLIGVVATQWSFAMAIVASVALQELTHQLSGVGSLSGVVYGAAIVIVGVALALRDKGSARGARNARPRLGRRPGGVERGDQVTVNS